MWAKTATNVNEKGGGRPLQILKVEGKAAKSRQGKRKPVKTIWANLKS